MALLAPAYEAAPQRQLRLIGAAEAAAEKATALASGGGEGRSEAGLATALAAEAAALAAARRGEARVVEVVSVDDHEAEAEYVVDQILRLRDHATSAAIGSSNGGGGHGGSSSNEGNSDGGRGNGNGDGNGIGNGGGGGRRAPSVAVLYRTNAQAMPLERELLRQGVRYQVVQARSFFQRKEVKDALCYLRLGIVKVAVLARP